MTIAKKLDPPPDISENVTLCSHGIYSDEPPLESELHLRQIILLLNCLERLWEDRNDFYAAGNLTIYYSEYQKKSEECRS